MSKTYRKLDPIYKEIFDTERDGKKWYKPNKIFKQLKKKKRKAKEREAFRLNKEIPEFPKTDTWNWN